MIAINYKNCSISILKQLPPTWNIFIICAILEEVFFDGLCNWLNKVQGCKGHVYLIFVMATTMYAYMLHHTWSIKMLRSAPFFSRQFTSTVIDNRKSNKVPDLWKKMSTLNVATAANDKRQFHWEEEAQAASVADFVDICTVVCLNWKHARGWQESWKLTYHFG